jgi:desampylase
LKQTLPDRSGLAIRAHAVRAVAAHARAAWPQECCGLLLGTAGSVEAVYPAHNEHEERGTCYLVRPQDHFAAIRIARAQALDVIGAYHSHPAGRPTPSATDRNEAHAGGFIYVIVGARRLRRTPCCRRLRARRRGAFRPPTRARGRCRAARSIEAHGLWVAAWRLVGGNFVEVPLVRLA